MDRPAAGKKSVYSMARKPKIKDLKMKKFIFCMALGITFGSLFFLLPSCTGNKCELEKVIVSGATTAISGALSCENPEALKPFVQSAVSKLHLCDTKQGVIGKMICAPAINAALSLGLSALPAEAKCSGGVPIDLAKSAAIAACEALFP